jgi:hypothetical protein
MELKFQIANSQYSIICTANVSNWCPSKVEGKRKYATSIKNVFLSLSIWSSPMYSYSSLYKIWIHCRCLVFSWIKEREREREREREPR